jgi:hypothetical protein
MAISTQEVIIALESKLPESAARPLREWMLAMRADQKALLAKLDADDGVTGTNYTSTIKQVGD